MFQRYPHEVDIYPSLSRIPLHVRMKLDVTGIKISLKDWLAFSLEERAVLCHLPIETDEEKQVFHAYLDSLSKRYCGAPATRTAAVNRTLWDATQRVPGPVAQKSAPEIPPVAVEEWRRWKSYQRYALYKTALSQSDPAPFFAVLQALRALED
jgi:hypothetical protein